MIQERTVIDTELQTLQLRELVPADATALFSLIGSNRRHLSGWGEDTSEKYPDQASVFRSITQPTNPRRLRFGIWYSVVLIGSVNRTREATRDEAEIGYWLSEEYMHRGYMTMAVKALVTYAFRIEGLRKLTARVRQGNQRSKYVLERLGFEFVYADKTQMHYALRAHDWCE